MTEGDDNHKTKARNVVTEFFRQTFRSHTGDEYSELLTRGMRGDGGVNKKYPWAYIRLFALIVILFAIYLLIVRFTSNELLTPTIMTLGSISVSLSFLIFLYELYPKKDLSIMLVCLAMLIGGALSTIITQVLFNVFTTDSKWLFSVFVGFFEELPKAISTVLILVVTRKNSPLAGFIIGAAVGCGFSIVEDMGYIFVMSNEMPVMNLTTIIEVAVGRGATALCTHILWTAAIGWAYCHFSRHLANVAFYLITLLSCGLHICWDLPLDSLPLAFIYVACGVIACVECLLILHFERRKVFNENPLPNVGLYVNENAVNQLAKQDNLKERSLDKSNPKYWRHWGLFSVALGTFLMAVISIIYCSIPFRETYGTETFYSPESFVDYMQNGLDFDVEEYRAYNAHDTANDVPETVGNRLTRVTQRVTDKNNENIVYNYKYTVSHDDFSNRDYFFLYSTTVTTTNELGISVEYEREDVYNDGLKYASFFRLNNSVTGFNFTSNGNITVFIYNPAFVRDLSDWKYTSLFITFASIFGASLVCYVSLSIKSWRVKKLCSTENASSVK